MDYRTACRMLDISPPFDVDTLRRHYYRACRKHHPDKVVNGDIHAVQDAHAFLLASIVERHDDETDHTINLTVLEDYVRILEALRIDWVDKYIIDPLNDYINKNVITYELSPTLEQMMRKEVFYLSEHKLYVPLWHSELKYTNHNVRVILTPRLPEGIWLDEQNNVHVSRDVVQVGTLRIDKRGCVITRMGIPRIKKNIYDASDLSDVIVH
jgi:hypothetical protein